MQFTLIALAAVAAAAPIAQPQDLISAIGSTIGNIVALPVTLPLGIIGGAAKGAIGGTAQVVDELPIPSLFKPATWGIGPDAAPYGPPPPFAPAYAPAYAPFATDDSDDK